MLVNTSFNVRGEPIVCTPEDAYRCFLATDMDALVLEDIVIVKDAAAREAGLEAAKLTWPSSSSIDLRQRPSECVMMTPYSSEREEAGNALVRHPV